MTGFGDGAALVGGAELLPAAAIATVSPQLPGSEQLFRDEPLWPVRDHLVVGGGLSPGADGRG
jgi:hypothetical protein